METYILFSGGRESLINLYRSLDSKPTLVLFNYGQKSFTKESTSMYYYAKEYKLKTIILKLKLNVPEAISKGKKVDNHVVGRNILFVFHLLNSVYSDKPIRILLGTTKDPRYKDNCSNFLRDMAPIVNKLYPNVTLDSMCKNIKDTRTYFTLVSMGADLTHLWFCERRGKKMCGKCTKCLSLKPELTHYEKG